MYGVHNCLDQINDCNRYAYATNSSDGGGNGVCNLADTFCQSNVVQYYDITFGRDEDDSRYLEPDPYPYYWYWAYLNNADIQAALGAYTNYSDGSTIVAAAYNSTGDDARNFGIRDICNNIIASNITFLMYFGDADYTCNWFSGIEFSETMSLPAGYNQSGYENFTTSDGVVHGQARAAGKYSLVRIYNSGHEVPFYQPLAALDMLNRTIHGLDIATGEVSVDSSYATTGPKMSTYVEGNSTVVTSIIPYNSTYNTTTNEPNAPFDVYTVGYNSTHAPGRLLTRMDHAAKDFVRTMMRRRNNDPGADSVIQKKSPIWFESRRRERLSREVDECDHDGEVEHYTDLFNEAIRRALARPKRGDVMGRRWRDRHGGIAT